jgi:hypothetical protein
MARATMRAFVTMLWIKKRYLELNIDDPGRVLLSEMICANTEKISNYETTMETSVQENQKMMTTTVSQLSGSPKSLTTTNDMLVTLVDAVQNLVSQVANLTQQNSRDDASMPQKQKKPPQAKRSH